MLVCKSQYFDIYNPDKQRKYNSQPNNKLSAVFENTFGDTIFYTSMPRTIFPAAKFYSIVREIITRKVVLGTTYSYTPLIKTPIPAFCKVAVRALKPTLVQFIDTCGSIANYIYKMP